MNSPLRRDPWFWLCILIPIGIGLQGYNSDLYFPDASRHAMNGVLIHDYLRDSFQQGIANPLTYAEQYYAHKPALSLGYHPPLLPLVEVPFYALFGVSPLSARCAVIGLILLGAIFWFRLLLLLYDRDVAVWGSLILWCAPVVVHWSQEVMPDIPGLSLLIVASYYLIRATRTNAPLDFYRTAIFAGLAMNLKHTAGLWLLVVVVVGWQSRKSITLKRRHQFGVAVCLLLLLAPLVALTAIFGMSHFTNNIAGKNLPQVDSLTNWLFYPRLIPAHLGWVFSLCLPLGIWAWWKNQDRYPGVIFFSWIAANYFLMSLIAYKSERLGLLWVAPLSGIAAIGIVFACRGLKQAPLRLVYGGLAFCLFQAFMFPVPRLSGQTEAATFVAAAWRGDTVLYDGYHNGAFIFRMRQLDPRNKRIVLRGSKVLSVTNVMPNFAVDPQVETPGDILALLRRYRTGLLVLEQENPLPLATSILLRKLIQDRPDRFTLVKTIPIRITNRQTIVNPSPLLIYRFTGDFESRKNTTLRLGMRTTGRDIELTLPE